MNTHEYRVNLTNCYEEMYVLRRSLCTARGKMIETLCPKVTHAAKAKNYRDVLEAAHGAEASKSFRRRFARRSKYLTG